jgi:hypothetical protein
MPASIKKDKPEYVDFDDWTLITRFKFNNTSVESGVTAIEGYIIDEGEKIDIAFTLVMDNGKFRAGKYLNSSAYSVCFI